MSQGMPGGGSLMGLETLTKQVASSSVADEQAKAEEEFKKSMYGTADGSSSDEEGTSKAKKLRIRIRDKPVASGKPPSPPSAVRPGQVPRGAAAPTCFKTGMSHLEQNQLSDALSCFDEAFLALAKDYSRGADIKAQATICAQYKIAVSLLQEIGRLQRVHGPSAVSAKDEMARLSRHLGSLPLLAKHRINCIRTAIKRNMEVQNYAYSKQMLELLLSKAPPSKQDELRSLVDMKTLPSSVLPHLVVLENDLPTNSEIIPLPFRRECSSGG